MTTVIGRRSRLRLEALYYVAIELLH